MTDGRSPQFPASSTGKRLDYVCMSCGGRFESDWTDEEARAEYGEKFKEEVADAAVVCDDCYKAMGSKNET